MQSRAHTQMPRSCFLADPLTWFLGSLNTRVIKHCFISGSKPKVCETQQILIHVFFFTHTAFSFSRCASSCKHAQHERSHISASLAKTEAYRSCPVLSAELELCIGNYCFSRVLSKAPQRFSCSWLLAWLLLSHQTQALSGG